MFWPFRRKKEPGKPPKLRLYRVVTPEGIEEHYAHGWWTEYERLDLRFALDPDETSDGNKFRVVKMFNKGHWISIQSVEQGEEKQ